MLGKQLLTPNSLALQSVLGSPDYYRKLLNLNPIALWPLNEPAPQENANLFNLSFEKGSLTGESDSFDSVVDPDVGEITAVGAAALGGTSIGVQIDINDQDDVYGVKALSPPASGTLRLRFYFDPNSLTMGGGEFFDILRLGTDGSPYNLASVRLYATGPYQVRMNFAEDDETTYWTDSGHNLTNGPNYLEFQIVRASSDTASDGTGTFWLNGVQIGSPITGLDNFDAFALIDEFLAGAVGGVDVGTSGSIYIDEFAANDTGAEIGPSPWMPVTEPSKANLFDLNFGSGTLTGQDDSFDSIYDPDNDLSVGAAGALGSTSFGMSAIIDDGVACTCTKLQAPTTDEFRVRFYFDPNGVTIPDDDEVIICQWIDNSAWDYVFGINFKGVSSAYRLVLITCDDDGFEDYIYSDSSISDAPHYIEVHAQRASSAVAGDGTVDWWIDGVEQTGAVDIDNYDLWDTMDQLYTGLLYWTTYTTASGTIFLDEFAVNDTGVEIGPVEVLPSVAQCLVNSAQNGVYTGVTLGDEVTPWGDPAPFFDGVNDFVNILTTTFISALDLTGSHSIFGWAKVANVGVWTDTDYRRAVALYTDSENYEFIATNGSGAGAFYSACEYADNLEIQTIATTETNWFPFAYVFDADADTATLYFDDKTPQTDPQASTWVGTLALAKIGARRDGTANFWHGWLSSTAIFDYALTSDQFESLRTV